MLRKIVNVAAVLVFLVGAGLFLYPEFTKWQGGQDSEKAIAQFEREVEQMRGESGDFSDLPENETEQEDKGEEQSKEQGEQQAEPSGQEEPLQEEKQPVESGGGSQGTRLEQLHRVLEEYNQEISAHGQSGLGDPSSYETPVMDLKDYGLSENVIGTIWIPRMDVRLPIYLGANSANMARGAGLLGQTSMPLGSPDSNVVIAAHRGYKGIPMFRNIQSLQRGDKIQITTPWETLIYRVCDLKIISPEDTDEILIQEGRDLVTLLTCHPYTKNYQRYLVAAERSFEPVVGEEEDLAEAEASASEEPQEVEVVTAEGTQIQKISTAVQSPVRTEGSEEWGAGYSQQQIWLETWLPPVGAGVLLLIIAAGIWMRRKDKRRS